MMPPAGSAVWGAVIVAAGQSSRFGPTDKIIFELCGRSVIGWSIEAFASEPRIQQLVLVCSPSNIDHLREIVICDFPGHSVDLCTGGSTRSESVMRGLQALGPDVTHVAVHDGARPLVSQELIAGVLDAAEASGAAVPAVRPASSIGVAMNEHDRLGGTLDRERLRELQTPQAATRAALDDAIGRFPGETDESAALFRAGYDVSLVDGCRSNVKITVASDLAIASALASEWNTSR